MTEKIIHVGKYRHPKQGTKYLFLRQKDPTQYAWYDDNNETSVVGSNVEEAIRLANYEWKNKSFSLLNCGFRYTLPERDEHGMNALFHQMIESYSSFNGVYFDNELGHNCFVQAASQEALTLWHQLQKK